MAYYRDKCEVTITTPTGKQTQIFRDYASLAAWAAKQAEEMERRFPPINLSQSPQRVLDLQA